MPKFKIVFPEQTNRGSGTDPGLLLGFLSAGRSLGSLFKPQCHRLHNTHQLSACFPPYSWISCPETSRGCRRGCCSEGEGSATATARWEPLHCFMGVGGACTVLWSPPPAHPQTCLHLCRPGSRFSKDKFKQDCRWTVHSGPPISRHHSASLNWSLLLRPLGVWGGWAVQ